LQQFRGNTLSMNALRHMLSREASVVWRLDRTTDDEVIEQAARLLGAGVWHVHAPENEPRTSASGREPVEKRQAAEASAPKLPQRRPDARKLTWIEIQLVDTTGRPVPGITYDIKLPDRNVLSGTLGSDGTALHREVVEGKCEVRFPELDGNNWRPG
jgi:hypothetical protein